MWFSSANIFPAIFGRKFFKNTQNRELNSYLSYLQMDPNKPKLTINKTTMNLQWTHSQILLPPPTNKSPMQWTNPRTSNHLPRHLIWKIYLPSHVFKNCSNICWHCYKYKLLHVVNLLILRRPWKTRLKSHSVQRCRNSWISNFNNPGKARMRPRTRHMGLSQTTFTWRGR